jgi:hypothetical protein
VREAGERQQMMLAQGAERNVPGQDHPVVSVVVGERGCVELARREQFGVGGGDPPGRIAVVLLGGIHVRGGHQVRDRVFRRVQVNRASTRDGPEPGRPRAAIRERNDAHETSPRREPPTAPARRARVSAASNSPTSRSAMS